jgi:hypothetical protein
MGGDPGSPERMVSVFLNQRNVGPSWEFFLIQQKTQQPSADWALCGATKELRAAGRCGLSIPLLSATEHRYLRLESIAVLQEPIITGVSGDSWLPLLRAKSIRIITSRFPAKGLLAYLCWARGGTLSNQYSLLDIEWQGQLWKLEVPGVM